MMNPQQFLPAVPQPPHDPMWWLLDPRAGWHEGELSDVEISATETITLARLPQSLPSMTTVGGSFGGLTTPANVAIGPDGSVFLLDARLGELKRFDSCECAFKRVPCFGGIGTGPRQLQHPHGVAICSGNLFVCDAGNHRLSVFTIHGFVLRGIWAPPVAVVTNNWEPYAIAFDGRGRAFVSDPANGCIHRFRPNGRWDRLLTGFGAIRDITIDCHDRIYVVTTGSDGNQEVQIATTEGNSLGKASRADLHESDFPPLPFAIDAAEHLNLCSLCPAPAANCTPAERRCVFDLEGRATSGPVMLPAQYAREGRFITTELDSRLYRCVWHRVVLCGDIPSGTSIRVLTYTAETPQTSDYISSLPDDAWETNQTARQLENGQWDCLITSDGGRYLWLQLQLKGNGASTPCVGSMRIEFPRITLRRYLPAVFGEDANGSSFTDRFLSIFDTTLRSIEQKVDESARYFDPLSTPTTPDPLTGIDFLTWLASWVGVTLDRQLAPEKRRQVLKRAASLYPIRGTVEGLRRQLLFFLGMEAETVCCSEAGLPKQCTPAPANCIPREPQPCSWSPPPLILEHFQLRRWLFLGQGKLGEQAALWGRRIVNRSQLDEVAQVGQTQLLTTQDPFRDPFHVYAHKFSAFVPACYGTSDSLRKGLENLLNAERPAQTQYQLVFVEPRFRIGFQSMIGLDSVVGRYPTAGVTLNQTSLGGASILNQPPESRGAPSLEVGSQSRIGTTTKLE